jgi:hypothetical protein
MVDQCTRVGFRALTTAEKLSSEVEAVLFGSDDTAANYRGSELPDLPTKSGGSTPPPSPPLPQ